MRLESNYYRDVMLRLEDPKELKDGAEKLTNEISAVERQLFEVTPTGRNFEVKIEKDRELALALERADGYTASLNTLLPENVRFCIAEGFWCFNKTFSGNKLVTFPPNKLQYRGGLLTLAHEIGHAHQPDTIPLSMADDTNCEKQEKFHRVLAQRERSAWAFALRTLRRLQKDGFNVFAGFHSRGEVQQFITCNLLSYEIERRSSLLEFGGQPALHKAKPLFVRGQGSPYSS
jgi:hypothetical protein